MSPSFGLPQSTLDEMRAIFARHNKVTKVVVYGSRAKGNYRNGSDIDLTMFGKNLTFQDLSNIHNALDDSSNPYLINLSIYNHLDNAKLREHIDRVGQVFYYRYEGWKKVKLGDVAVVIAGQSPAGENYNKDGVGTPFMQGKKDYGDKFPNPPTVWTTSVTKLAEKGDILMSVRAPVGALNIANQQVCIGRGLAAIRASENIELDYLFYALLQISAKLEGSSGAIFNSINKKQIEEIEFLLPPLAEQQRIVAKLDAAFAEIDYMLKSSHLKRAEVKSLPTKIVKKMLEDETYDWTSERLSSIADNLDAQRIPITKSKRTLGNIPYYGASGIVDYVENFIFDEKLLLISEDGANLLARTYPIAFSIEGKTWVNNHAHVLKFENRMLQKWVEYYLNSTNIEAFISGMAQPKLNQKKLNEIPIPCPKPNLLPKLLSNLEQIASQNEIVFELQTKKIEHVEKLKSAILLQELQSEVA